MKGKKPRLTAVPPLSGPSPAGLQSMPPWLPRVVDKIKTKGQKKTVYTLETHENGNMNLEFETKPKKNNLPIVYVIQEIVGTRAGRPRINILGAAEYGTLKFLLPELSQIVFSPGPLIFKLKNLLKKFTTEDFLLLTGDPALIGVACSIVSDITGGTYKLLKWDKQENKYYPITINLYEKGKIDE